MYSFVISITGETDIFIIITVKENKTIIQDLHFFFIVSIIFSLKVNSKHIKAFATKAMVLKLLF